jgi:hypothetical protein
MISSLNIKLVSPLTYYFSTHVCVSFSLDFVVDLEELAAAVAAACCRALILKKSDISPVNSDLISGGCASANCHDVVGRV